MTSIHSISSSRYRQSAAGVALALSIVLASPIINAAGSECLPAPELPSPQGKVVSVTNESELQAAINRLTDNTTIILQPGDYWLTSTVYIKKDNVTLRGAVHSCDAVTLMGRGMNNANYGNVPHGIWSNSVSTKVQNLSIRDVYFHAIALNNGSESPQVYNVKLLDSGEQFIKASAGPSFGDGTDNGVVEFTIMEYLGDTPSHAGSVGYTNGVDVHGGSHWVIRDNLFKGLHTPDSADYLWNPAVLMWRGSKGTVTEGNVFIDVTRAIAYGLEDEKNGNSHSGGIIRNNMIIYTDGLFSSLRKLRSDGAILVWDSPKTKVYHNTALTNNNINKFIEFRFDTNGAQARNNLGDREISGRSGAVFSVSDNDLKATEALFVDPTRGNLRLTESSHSTIDAVPRLDDAISDIDGVSRPSLAQAGASQFVEYSSPRAPQLTEAN